MRIIILQDDDFTSATTEKDIRRAIDAAKNQITMFNTETALPLQKYSKFALELALLFKTDTQKKLVTLFNGLYGSLQGRDGDMFNAPEKLSLTEAIKKHFNLENYVPIRQTERTTVARYGAGSTEREPGRYESPEGREKIRKEKGQPSVEEELHQIINSTKKEKEMEK